MILAPAALLIYVYWELFLSFELYKLDSNEETPTIMFWQPGLMKCAWYNSQITQSLKQQYTLKKSYKITQQLALVSLQTRYKSHGTQNAVTDRVSLNSLIQKKKKEGKKKKNIQWKWMETHAAILTNISICVLWKKEPPTALERYD